VRSFFEHKRNSLTPAKIVMIILRFIFQLVGKPENGITNGASLLWIGCPKTRTFRAMSGQVQPFTSERFSALQDCHFPRASTLRLPALSHLFDPAFAGF
jgi:hypothetical protein